MPYGMIPAWQDCCVVNIENGRCHVYARGLDRMSIYRDDRDVKHFQELLESMVERYLTELHAFALMDTQCIRRLDRRLRQDRRHRAEARAVERRRNVKC